MPQLKLFAIAVIAVSAISAVATSVASAALPEFLPGTKNTFTVSSGKAKLEQKGGIAPIECEKGTGSGSPEGAKTANLDLLFENCSAPLAGKCTGLDDTKLGSILVKGALEVSYIDKATKDVGILFKIKPVHLECEKLVILVMVEGCVIGLVTPINSDVKEFTVKLKQTKGVNEFTKDEGGECKLSSEINSSAKAQAGFETEAIFTLTNLYELMA